MAYINVNHSKFSAASDAIDKYTSKLQNRMNTIQSEVNNLASTWEGSDYQQFKSKWNEAEQNGSTTMEMKKTLDEYSKYLKNACKKYKKAQVDAIDRANKLPKW